MTAQYHAGAVSLNRYWRGFAEPLLARHESRGWVQTMMITTLTQSDL